MRNSVLLQVVLLALAFSCAEEKINKPVFMTLAVTELSPEGVTLNGKILMTGGQDITGFGFQWSDHTSQPSDSVVTFNELPADGNFQHRVTDGLTASTKYYARVFLIVHGQEMYANTIQFDALGSSTPVILDFTPTSGSASETVVIKGSHLGAVLSKTSVKIGEATCRVTSVSLDEVTFQTPADYITGTYPIVLKVADKVITSARTFTLNGPIIQSISPSAGPAGTIVTIAGTGFSTTPASNIIYFADKKASVTSATETEVQVIVPVNSLAGEKQLSFEYNHGKGFSAVPYNLTGPLISSITPASGYEGTQITINGSGFSLIPAENSVKINSWQYVNGTVVSATPNQLIVDVGPVYYSGDLPQLESNITVEVKTIWALAQTKFVLKGPAFTGFSPTSQYEGRIVTIEGSDFDPNGSNQVYFNQKPATIISYTSTSLTVRLPFGDQGLPLATSFSIASRHYHYYPTAKFNVLSPWQKLSDFPAGARYGTTAFTIGPYSYVGLGINAGDKKDFWRFDSNNNSWQRMADFPGQSRAFAFSFVINGNGYVGGGGHYGYSSYDLISNLNDLWEYDPTTDSWTAKQSFPSTGNKRYQATGIGDFGYFSLENSLYKYDPSLNQWSVTAAPTSFAMGGIAGTVGGKGYFGLGINSAGMWEYDPVSGSWAELASSPLVLPVAWGTLTCFTLNNKIYAASHNMFVQFDPASNVWTQLPSIPVELIYKGAFAVGNLGYMITGLNGYGSPIFYSFDPTY